MPRGKGAAGAGFRYFSNRTADRNVVRDSNIPAARINVASRDVHDALGDSVHAPGQAQIEPARKPREMT
jgi:hypothetical protein